MEIILECHLNVWRKAMADAESDVMRATATVIGGRKPNESLMDYVERSKQLQEIAIIRFNIAKQEVDKLEYCRAS